MCTMTKNREKICTKLLILKWKQLTTAKAYPIFWIYLPIKAVFAQIRIEIAAADEICRTMTLSVVL